MAETQKLNLTQKRNSALLFNKNLVLSCLVTVFLSACSVADLYLKTYGHPSEHSSAKEWMSLYYIDVIRFDGEPVGYEVGGDLFSSYKKAQQWMLDVYTDDYEQFFKHCFDMHQRGEVCEMYQ